MTHTQEPWQVAETCFDNDGAPESVIQGLDGRAFIAVTLDFGPNNPAMREANARRIVACVNACRGLSTDDLEKTGLVSAVGHELLRLEQQRDDLLTALSYITALPQANGAMKLAQFRAEQAIAKVKGGFQ